MSYDSINVVSLGSVSAIFMFVFIGAIVYSNLLIWSYYLTVLLWAFLISQALRPLRKSIVTSVRSLLLGEEEAHKLKREKKEREKKQAGIHDITSTLSHKDDEEEKSPFIQTTINYSFAIFAIALMIVAGSRFFGIKVMGIVIASLIGVAALFVTLLKPCLLHIASNKKFVSACLIFNILIMAVSVFIILGVFSVIEGVHAVEELIDWVQGFISDNDPLMEQVVGNVTMFAHQKYEEFIVTNYNHTEWWPAVHNLEVAIVNRTDNITAALFTSKDLLASVYGEESWWNPIEFMAVTLLKQQGSARDKATGFLSEIAQDIDFLGSVGTEVMAAIANPVNLILLFMKTGVSFFVSIGNTFYLFLGFFLFLYDLTVAEQDLLEFLVDVFVPTRKSFRKKVFKQCQGVISLVFFMPSCMASLHAMVTLIAGSLCGIRFTFFVTLLSFVFTFLGFNSNIVPLIWGAVSASTMLLYSLERYEGLAFFTLCYFLYDWGDSKLLSQKRMSGFASPYLTLFALVLGFFSYGVPGVFLGPLALLLLFMSAHLRVETQEYFDQQHENTGPSVFIRNETAGEKRMENNCSSDTISDIVNEVVDDDDAARGLGNVTEKLEQEPQAKQASDHTQVRHRKSKRKPIQLGFLDLGGK
eukprot:m.96774 g.96774  ORF g.96774 m.96774 type:complete len:641 (-) comp8974_c1_seq1:275-2197(-)